MALTFTLDGSDITDAVLEASVTPRLSRARRAYCLGASHELPAVVSGVTKLKITGDESFHGRVQFVEHKGDANKMMTKILAAGPMIHWDRRMARDAGGDYSKPSFIADFQTAPQILEEILSNTISLVGGLEIALGTFDTGGADISGVPVDWPKTVMQIAMLLEATGELDIIEAPIDSGGNTAEISAYNGDFGSDLSGSVSFGFATGPNNVDQITWTQDAEKIANRIRYLLGPRKGTKNDPAGDQHWDGDVDITNPNLPDPPGASLVSLVEDSRTTYLDLEDVKVYDGDGESSALELWYRLFSTEAQLRAKPREFVHITPTRGLGLGSFGLGDRIAVAGGATFAGGFSGVQRVYGYTVSLDREGVVSLTDIVTSPDAETL